MPIEILGFAAVLVIIGAVFVWAYARFRFVPPDAVKDVSEIAAILAMAFPLGWVLLARGVFSLHDPAAPPPATEIGAAAGLVALCVLALGRTGFWHQWTPWLPQPKGSFLITTFGTIVAWIVLTTAFTSITVLAGQLQLIQVQPPLLGPTAAGQQLRPDAWVTIEGIYVWNLLDMIPSLRVPATINWTLSHSIVDTVGGIILLVYKILVVLPLVGLIRTTLTGRAETLSRDQAIAADPKVSDV